MGLIAFFNSLAHRTTTVPPTEGSVLDIVAYELSISNKFVDLYFSQGVYAEAEAAIEASDLRITDFSAGGVSAISIASIKQPDHYLSASASAVDGGDTVIRVFLTLTGTPDGTETFQIRPVANSIYDVGGIPMVANLTTGVITLNVTPFNLWDAEVLSSVTTTSLGISAFNDIMGNVNLAQGTDADRPLHYRQRLAQFDRANTEFLTGGTHANYERQQANNFAIFVKDLYYNMDADTGLVIAYFSGSNNHGWFMSAGTAGVRLFMGDNSATKLAIAANHEDQRYSFIVQNEGGTLSIYDENNNRIGSQGTTNIGTIVWTGIDLYIGRRETITTNALNGDWAKLAFYTQALTSAQRLTLFRNQKKVVSGTVGTLTKYLYPVVNGSTDSSAKDTMQVFNGNTIILRGGTLYLHYCANAADGDIDRDFVATKTDDGDPFTPFIKVLDAGLPKVIIGPSLVNGTYDENEVFCMSVFDDDEEVKYYFLANQIGASPAYTVGLATAPLNDVLNFTKQGQVYTDGTTNIIRFPAIKWGPGDYRVVVSTSAVGGDTNNFSYDYATSPDGVTWTKQFNINDKLKNIILVVTLFKMDDVAYLICTADSRDSDQAVGSSHVVYKTENFIDYEFLGQLNFKDEPTERGLGFVAPLVREDSIDFFYHYYKNQNKTSNNGGEGYCAIRQATLNTRNIGAAVVESVYPPWVKKYWPLNRESGTGLVFQELIDGGTATFAGTAQWSNDGLNFFDAIGTGFSFSAISIASWTQDLALKMRVEIVTSGTINLFSIGTDIVVQLVSGNLRVALNNATKDYITTADIAKPSGITDPGNHVYVGFIWQGGTLRLCVGNTIGIAVTQTVNNAMTDIANNGSAVLIGDSATIELGRVVLMSGQTDQQWIDTDI